ncbi:ABC transporter permease [Marinilactibacillus sp. XAAS-LB27]|uniref:ABC transporter permease n=1 Tax=Marinilactibacillus sp. XAAS-LB27 TaxID=3114538 RepID=UPI002E1924B3|nr:ABC transporter permease [Marinilactibacillus sp. XAAS-LB27]
MKSIYLYGLKYELKSIKTIVVSLVFTGLSFLIANFSPSLTIAINNNGVSPAIDTLFVLYMFLGFLFSSILFGGIISREIETETIRYISPYLSRKKIYLAKYLVTLTYFALMIVFSLTILFVSRGAIVIPLASLANILVFFLYTLALVLLISTVSRNERTATLIGIVLSLLFPIIFTYTFFKDYTLLNILNWLLPFRYLNSGWEILILLLLAILVYILGATLFERKSL